MNIVFFGTSEFAMPALKALFSSRHKVLALVTQPDRKRGRSLKVSPSPTKVLALEKAIPVYQPEDASSAEASSYLRKLNADLFVVVSFGQILKGEILDIPKFYSVNLHGSLLPKYRGAAPTNWAIINGEEVTGITVIRMNEEMDAGDVILKRELKIDNGHTNITLSEELSDIGALSLLEAIDLIGSGKAVLTRQNRLEVTYAPKLTKMEGLINWDEPAIKIHNKVRGLVPWPGAYTRFGAKILKILRTGLPDKILIKNAQNGEVIDIVKDKGILVKTGSGSLLITHLQLEGKKILDAAAFLRGHRIGVGHRFI